MFRQTSTKILLITCLTAIVILIMWMLFFHTVDKGWLHVKCEAGAFLLLDGDLLGVSTEESRGLINHDVSVGEYELKAVKGGFQPQVKIVTVVKDSVSVVEFGVFAPMMKITESGESEDATLKSRSDETRKTLGITCYHETSYGNISDTHKGCELQTGVFEVLVNLV